MKTTDKRKREILESLRGGLVVSCQVQPEDPIYTKDMAVKMAEAAKWAGAVGIRANTPEQIRQIREAVQLPVIGLYKIWNEDTGVYITPTLEAAKAVWEAGADIIMLDNMCPEDMRAAVKLIAGRARTECSGNVTRENISRLADIGVDYISSGALTHSAPILDLSMKHLRPLEKEVGA